MSEQHVTFLNRIRVWRQTQVTRLRSAGNRVRATFNRNRSETRPQQGANVPADEVNGPQNEALHQYEGMYEIERNDLTEGGRETDTEEEEQISARNDSGNRIARPLVRGVEGEVIGQGQHVGIDEGRLRDPPAFMPDGDFVIERPRNGGGRLRRRRGIVGTHNHEDPDPNPPPPYGHGTAPPPYAHGGPPPYTRSPGL